MCRIYGHFNADVPAAILDRVATRQRHGGPDGGGHTRGSGWALGINRLAVMDPDGGRQPYEMSGITVVFNGELYNHDELRANLRAQGYTFTDRCDGSILPALYHRYGDRFTDHLDGMYALAVLDHRAEPRLVLATDHIGMKPLYYHWDPASRSLWFASEIPALLAFGAVPDTMWEPGLDAYLATKTPFGEQTMFAGIRVLPPASTAICDRATGFRITRRTARPSDVDGTLTETMRHEVRRLLVADVPVATITSGGLDSSLVTALAAQAMPVHTFNIAYRGDWPSDERHFAREVAERAGAVYHQVEIDPATFPDLLERTVRHLGQPNADPITLSSYALFAAVREAGFTVALTGDAADELFGGYGRMRAAATAAAAGRPWFESYLDDLGVLLDETASLWLARPAPDWSAVELRVADTAIDVDAALLQAALSRALVRTALTDHTAGRPAPRVDAQVAAAAVWSAARYGMSGPGVHPVLERQAPPTVLLSELVAAVRPALEETGDMPVMESAVRRLLKVGTGAARQRAVPGTPFDVVRMLATSTVPSAEDRSS